jgi:hypothetical protein
MPSIVYYILDKIFNCPAFKTIDLDQLNELKIVEALPDDYLVNPIEIAPTLIMSDVRFNDFFTDIFDKIKHLRWDVYNKHIPDEILMICQIGLKYIHNDEFKLFNKSLKDCLTISHIRQIKDAKDDLVTYEDFAKALGFVPPNGFGMLEVERYILKGISARNPSQFHPDDDVILERARRIGFEFSYSSYSDLRLNFMRWTDKRISGLFIVHKPLFSFSINQQLYITTEPLSEVNDKFLIGYGSLTKYHCYALEEILSCIDCEEIKIVWPHDMNAKMSKMIINEIIELLYNTGYIVDSLILKNKLKQYTQAKADLTKLLNTYKVQFELMSNGNKMKVISVMTNMLMAGMYMRRWTSSDKPYPISREASSINFVPDTNISIAMLKLTNLLIDSEVEVFVNRLPAFCLNYVKNNEVVPARLEIGKMIAKTISGESCVRIFSTIFITTAQVYTKLFVDVDLLPELRQLDYIN